MSRVFGAPGKAMMAGGYLVLDPAYKAYVTALSSRMHARIAIRDGEPSIRVTSPQFGGEWTYTIDFSGDVATATEVHGRKNPFLHATVQTVLNYVQPTSLSTYDITLFSDPGYHTQEATTPRTSANGNRTFLYHLRPIDQVPKTGMGLSAGMVAVVSAALLCAILGKLAAELQDVVHNVAQIAHCDAQGKIGSGFDVAAAVYGSIIYRRFAPTTIDHLLGRTPSAALSRAVREVVDSQWECLHTQCSIPPGVRLVMGDVNGGSETPKLVSKVLAWRKADPASADLYARLNAANEGFIAALAALHELLEENPDKYREQVRAGTAFGPLSDAIGAIRSSLQELTARSGADVEPPVQTALLDECARLPGCLGGVVPGAGGYDAVSLLVEENKLAQLKQASVDSDAFAKVSWLELSEETQGLIEESAADYEEL